MTRRLVGILVWMLAGLTAFGQAPGLGAPTMPGGDDSVTSAAGNQSGAVISRGANGFLAVWTDERTTIVGINNAYQTQTDVYGMRLDEFGVPVDTVPFVIAGDFGHQRAPEVAWNGSSWLVVWEQQEPNEFFYRYNVVGMRVAADGTTLDPQPLLLFENTFSSSNAFAVGSNGNGWLVASRNSESGSNDILGRRVNADGTLPDATPQLLVQAQTFLFSNLSVVAASGEYLVVYEELDAFARRFDDQLNPIGGEIPLPGSSVASDGSGYYVAWTSAGSLVGSTMLLNGTLGTPGGTLITSASNRDVRVAWADTQWWVSWLESFDDRVTVARISPSGSVTDPGGIALDPGAQFGVWRHRIAGGAAGRVQVVWDDHHQPGPWADDVLGQSVAGNGSIEPERSVALGSPSQVAPRLTRGPGEFLATFVSRVSGTSRLMLQRLNGLGAAIDTQPVVAAESASLVMGSAAWNGNEYLVVWSDNGQIMGRRFAADLSPLDSAAFGVMDGVEPDVAALADTFLVIAAQENGHRHFVEPAVARVANDGTVMDPGGKFISSFYARKPRVTAVGDRWLAVWQKDVSHDNPDARVWASWIALDGTHTPHTEIATDAFEPALAYSGANALVVYRRFGAPAPADYDIGARLLQPDGTLLGGEILVSGAANRQGAPSATWDGQHFVVVWEDLRTNSVFFDEREDIFAARIGEDGSLIDPAGFSVAAGTDPETQPAVASLDGDTLIGISSFERAPFDAYRLTTFHLDGVSGTPPAADFAGGPGMACAPFHAQFTDMSSGGPDEWAWSFGDGESAGEQHPQHTYTQAGKYAVMLTARRQGAADTAVKFDYITAASEHTADFSAEPTTGCAPLAVQFTDQSSGFPTGWNWDFGDDTVSTEKDPGHTYAYPGSFAVSLRAEGCGSDLLVRSAWIQVDGMCPLERLVNNEQTLFGTAIGDFTRTHQKFDGQRQELIEELTGTAPDTIAKLDHRWRFDVEPGESADFVAEISAFSLQFEPWLFEYSTDNQNFLPLVRVDDDLTRVIRAALPAGTSGTLWIRIRDEERTPGETYLNSLDIDYLAVETVVAEPVRPSESVRGLVFDDKATMTWQPSPSASFYDLLRGQIGDLRVEAGIGSAGCLSDDIATTGVSDAATPQPGEGFFYLVRGDADGRLAGTFDNPPAFAGPDEGRDGEVGTGGGSACGDRP